MMKQTLDLVKIRNEYKREFYRVNSKEILLQIGSIAPHLLEHPLKQAKDYLYDIKQIEEQEYRLNIHNVIKNTDTYKRLNNLYISYINQNLSEFVKSQGLTDSMDITMLYQYLLDLGVLSYSSSYRYDFEGLRYRYQENEILDTLGARIASGRGVCRHTSFQLTNLQQNLGNDVAALLDLITLPDFEENLWDEYKKRIFNAPNHAINIIFDEKGIYGYCSTTRNFFNVEEKDGVLLYSPVIQNRNLHIPYSTNLDTFSKEIVENQKVRKKYAHEDSLRYQDISSINAYNRELSKLRFMSSLIDDISKANKRILDGKTINIRQNKIACQVIDNLDEIKSFHKDTKPMLYKIDSLYNSIAPLTKQKVKSLKIR